MMVESILGSLYDTLKSSQKKFLTKNPRWHYPKKSFNMEPYGKMNYFFLRETRISNSPKLQLYMNNHWVIDPSQNCYFLCQSKIEDGHYRTNLTSIRLKSAVIIHYVAAPPKHLTNPIRCYVQTKSWSDI